MFLLTMILCVALTVSCNWQSGETAEEKSKAEIITQTTTNVKMSITGMTCMACVASVKNQRKDARTLTMRPPVRN